MKIQRFRALDAAFPGGLVALAAWLLLLVCSIPAHAADAPAATDGKLAKPNKEDTAGVKCASVVIRNCRARFVPDATAQEGAPEKSAQVPGRWEAVRNVEPDSEEIIVEETRVHHPEVHEAFERYLGVKGSEFLTRRIAGGARCTTIASTGATFCSHTGAQAPADPTRADFSDGVF